MTYQQAHVEVPIAAPLEHVAELVTTAVSRLGWRIKFVNEKLRQLSGFDNKTERLGQDMWRYSFDAFIKWRKSDSRNSVFVSVTVTEKEMSWTEEDCKKRCEEIIRGIEQDARELSENEINHPPSDSFGSARWATSKDLEHAGYEGGRGNPRRFVLGPDESKKCITVPEAETEMHAVVCGPTGCGKSSTIFIPNLIERTGASAVVTEATAGSEQPDLFFKTAGFRKMAGHAIYKFNPDDLTSHRINPIDFVKTYEEAATVAELIVKNTKTTYTADSDVWEKSEKQLLTVLILHAVSENGHLGMIRRWLRLGADGLARLLGSSTIKEARDEYLGFYRTGTEGFRNSALAGLMQRLNLWVNPRIVALTETTDVDLQALHRQLFTFYLSVPAEKDQYKPLAALIFNFLLNAIARERFTRPLALFLDEFTNFGKIPGIAEKMTIIRHLGIPATLGMQDFVQLRKVYGDDDATLLFGQAHQSVLSTERHRHCQAYQ